MPFERGSPDKNHSRDLMRSSWPGSSDPSQRRRSRCARSTAGDRYPAERGARRRAGPTAGPGPCWARRIPHGPRGARARAAALEQKERREEAATARGSATKRAERKPKRVNNAKEGKGNGTKHRGRGVITKSRGAGELAGRQGTEEERTRKETGGDRTKRVNGGEKKRRE